MPHTWDPSSLSPEQALQRLVDGNRRFREASGTSWARGWSPQLAAETQRPFAIILGCSDSRTPVEILFDAGFGDLFVVRVAGNIVAPSVIGSIDFAASQFGSRLVVVMGHTRCGAIAATVKAIETGLGPSRRTSARSPTGLLRTSRGWFDRATQRASSARLCAPTYARLQITSGMAAG